MHPVISNDGLQRCHWKYLSVETDGHTGRTNHFQISDSNHNQWSKNHTKITKSLTLTILHVSLVFYLLIALQLCAVIVCHIRFTTPDLALGSWAKSHDITASPGSIIFTRCDLISDP